MVASDDARKDRDGLPRDDDAGLDAAEDAVPAEDELLTIAQVAERAGVHENTVRRYLKTEEIPFYVRDLSSGRVISGNQPQDRWPGRYQYLLSARVAAYIASQVGDSVGSSGELEVRAEDTPTTAEDASLQELAQLRAELAETRRQLHMTQEQVEQLRDERDWLREHLRDVTSFLPAAREDVDQARSEVDQLQQRARRLERERELERRARELAMVRFSDLSWWGRLTTNFEELFQRELTRLREEEQQEPEE